MIVWNIKKKNNKKSKKKKPSSILKEKLLMDAIDTFKLHLLSKFILSRCWHIFSTPPPPPPPPLPHPPTTGQIQKSLCMTPASASTFTLKFFKSSYFLDCLMDLVYIWYNDRHRFKVSISNVLPWPIGHKVKSLKRTRLDFRGHSFNAIFMKFGNNVYLN